LSDKKPTKGGIKIPTKLPKESKTPIWDFEATNLFIKNIKEKPRKA